ncbi:hypothetical protein HWB51_gp093 [Mycobacterium phage Cuke]|uniref:Uncharacterized protein n=1 Tax=Mycobacterium phage Cuke TaxID=2079417 RepID=A0A2L1IX03_9CAUD|nr:hypothetical protein HWB51_gp093 [Mycobacterium phage Cuke]AVD99719.1 hypothetical protein SEA_CUKE_103 [Mycobacterium phage Cuke]
MKVSYRCNECPKDKAPEPTTDLDEFKGHMYCVHGLSSNDIEVQDILIRKVKRGQD